MESKTLRTEKYEIGTTLSRYIHMKMRKMDFARAAWVKAFFAVEILAGDPFLIRVQKKRRILFIWFRIVIILVFTEFFHSFLGNFVKFENVHHVKNNIGLSDCFMTPKRNQIGVFHHH